MFRGLGGQRAHRSQPAIGPQTPFDVVVDRHPGRFGRRRQRDERRVEFVLRRQRPGLIKQGRHALGVGAIGRCLGNVGFGIAALPGGGLREAHEATRQKALFTASGSASRLDATAGCTIKMQGQPPPVIITGAIANTHAVELAPIPKARQRGQRAQALFCAHCVAAEELPTSSLTSPIDGRPMMSWRWMASVLGSETMNSGITGAVGRCVSARRACLASLESFLSASTRLAWAS